MLTTATLGMLAYGLYATGWAIAHLSRLEWWVVARSRPSVLRGEDAEALAL
jgi:hypothetical protein